MPSKTKNTKAKKIISKKSVKKGNKKSVKKVEEKKVEEKKVEEKKVEEKKVEEKKVETKNNKTKNVRHEDETKIDEEFGTMIGSIKTLVQNMRELQKSTKNLHVQVNKRFRILNKQKSKRGGANQKLHPSGFNKPTKITKEFATFLNVDVDMEMPRTEATRMLHNYIKEHKLQDPNDGRKINCDKKLKGLLNVPKDVQLSYFNLQTYLSPHFIKTVKPKV